MLSSFFLRAALDIARGAVHRADPPPAESTAPRYTSVMHLVRAHRTSRPASSVVGECIHATGVLGGFGASGAHKKWAAEHLERGTEWSLPVEPADTEEQTVRRIAILGRYCGAFGDALPYHTIVAPWGQAFGLRSIEERTAHGNGANARYCGFALDGWWTKSGGPVPPVMVEGASWALRHRAERLHNAHGHPEITSHRAHAPGRLRGGDPGPHVWRQVVLPLVAEGVYTESLSTSREGTLPPASWGAA